MSNLIISKYLIDLGQWVITFEYSDSSNLESTCLGVIHNNIHNNQPSDIEGAFKSILCKIIGNSGLRFGNKIDIHITSDAKRLDYHILEYASETDLKIIDKCLEYFVSEIPDYTYMVKYNMFVKQGTSEYEDVKAEQSFDSAEAEHLYGTL